MWAVLKVYCGKTQAEDTLNPLYIIINRAALVLFVVYVLSFLLRF